MTDEDVLITEGIDGTVTSGLIRLFVAFEEEVSTAITHINTLAVQIGTVNSLTTTYGNTVVTLRTLTTIVP